jgi:pyrroloquinoline-quinone synthase
MALPIGLKDYLETTVGSLRLEAHPYFSNLLNGNTSKSAFVESQKHFAYMVKYFSRPMASVIANIPNAITRSALVANLWEEHGQGDPQRIHGRTIVTLVERLGGDVDALPEDEVVPVVDVFNSALKGIAAYQDYRLSTSVFGGIERTFVDVSHLICKGIISRGWLPEGQITHYSLHKEIDIRHAEEFLEVAAESWGDPDGQVLIKRGIRLGARLFANVYTEFAHHCQEWQ